MYANTHKNTHMHKPHGTKLSQMCTQTDVLQIAKNWDFLSGFQQFSSSKLVLKSVEKRWASPKYFAIGSTCAHNRSVIKKESLLDFQFTNNCTYIYVCIYRYACIYRYVCIYIYVCMYVCVHKHHYLIWVYKKLNMCICTRVYICKCKQRCTHVCVHVYVYTTWHVYEYNTS